MRSLHPGFSFQSTLIISYIESNIKMFSEHNTYCWRSIQKIFIFNEFYRRDTDKNYYSLELIYSANFPTQSSYPIYTLFIISLNFYRTEVVFFVSN